MASPAVVPGEVRRESVEIHHGREEDVTVRLLFEETNDVVLHRSEVAAPAAMDDPLLLGVRDQDGLMHIDAVVRQVRNQHLTGECLLR